MQVFVSLRCLFPHWFLQMLPRTLKVALFFKPKPERRLQDAGVEKWFGPLWYYLKQVWALPHFWLLCRTGRWCSIHLDYATAAHPFGNSHKCSVSCAALRHLSSYVITYVLNDVSEALSNFIQLLWKNFKQSGDRQSDKILNPNFSNSESMGKKNEWMNLWLSHTTASIFIKEFNYFIYLISSNLRDINFKCLSR